MLHPATRFILFTFWAVLLLPSFVSADVLHQVTPRTIEATVKPGDVLSRTVTVTNNHPHRINVYPSVHGLHLSDGATSTSEVRDREESVFGDWTTLTHAAQTLDAGESITLPVRFVVDRDVEPGTYHGLLGFGRGVSRPVAEQAVERGAAPTVVLRFTVPEPTVDESSAFSLEVLPVVLDEGQQIVRYTIHNPSSRSVVPRGELIFFNQRGEEVAAIPLNTDNATLQPGELYQGAESVSSTLALGTYRVDARVSFGSGQIAALALSDSFMFVPWQWILAFLAALLVIGIIVYVNLRRRYAYPVGAGNGETALPLHVYKGTSPAEDHDINLKQ